MVITFIWRLSQQHINCQRIASRQPLLLSSPPQSLLWYQTGPHALRYYGLRCSAMMFKSEVLVSSRILAYSFGLSTYLYHPKEDHQGHRLITRICQVRRATTIAIGHHSHPASTPDSSLILSLFLLHLFLCH